MDTHDLQISEKRDGNASESTSDKTRVCRCEFLVGIPTSVNSLDLKDGDVKLTRMTIVPQDQSESMSETIVSILFL